MSRKLTQGIYKVDRMYLEDRPKYHRNMNAHNDGVGKFNPIFHTYEQGQKYYEKTAHVGKSRRKV